MAISENSKGTLKASEGKVREDALVKLIVEPTFC